MYSPYLLLFHIQMLFKKLKLLAERDERLAVPLVPDFDDEGEAEVDQAAMYAKMAYEAQMEREKKQATSESKQNQLRQKKKTPLVIEIDNGSKKHECRGRQPI